MHTYTVKIVARDFKNPIWRSVDLKADNIDNLRRNLLKEYGWQLETEDGSKKIILIVFKDLSHYVMNDWIGQMTTGNSPRVKWVTKNAAYVLNKDGTLGRRL